MGVEGEAPKRQYEALPIENSPQMYFFFQSYEEQAMCIFLFYNQEENSSNKASLF